MKTRLSVILSLITALLITGCGGGTGEFRVTEGSEKIGSAPKGTIVATTSARIVHVDELERIATIRSGSSFSEGDFITTSNGGKQTGVLKIEPVRPEALRTAYILEGEPGINDIAEAVSASESERLSQLYPDQEAF